jgi:hypothetical protein
MFWPYLAVEFNSNTFEKHTPEQIRFFTESRLHESFLRIQMFPDTKFLLFFPDSRFSDTSYNRDDFPPDSSLYV